MTNLDVSAAAVISGGYERRRGYLTAAAYTVSQVTAVTTVAIWGYLMRWDLILQQNQFDWGLFARQAAWAGALSSIVLAVWRIYARMFVAQIFRLYPGLYLCERLVLPPEVCTVNHPDPTAALSREDITQGFDFRDFTNKQLENRSDTLEDRAAVAAIVAFSVVSLAAGYKARLITFTPAWPPHEIGLMLLINLIGVLSIVRAYQQWCKKIVKWPVRRLNNAAGPPGH